MSKKPQKDFSKSPKNITWELNHSIIRDSYVKLIRDLKRKPTIAEVSKDTKLSTKTIDKHLRELRFDPKKNPLRILTEDVLMSIANSAKKGSSASQKLWFQISEGWSERQIFEHEGEININDTRKKLIEKLKNAAGNNQGNNKKS